MNEKEKEMNKRYLLDTSAILTLLKGELLMPKVSNSVRFILCLTVLTFVTLLLNSNSSFCQQNIKVGFIPGRGDDALVEAQAFANAKIEYKVIGKNDYQIPNLLTFDVIAIGVVAYDKNEDLLANIQNVKEYAKRGGYVVTVDFQQDSTWKEDYFPFPITLFDDDLEEGVGVEIIDHPIWKSPNKITKDHFVGWGAGDFVADAPHDAKSPWKPLLKSNNWPIVIGAQTGTGYAVFSSLQILQALGRTGNKKIAEVLQNFLFWKGPLAVDPKGKMTIEWGKLKTIY